MSIRVVALLASALALSLGGTAVAAPSQTPPRDERERPNVDELLERFPIGSKAVVTGTKREVRSPKKAEPAAPPAVNVPVDEPGRDWSEVAIAGAGAALLLALLIGALGARRARARPADVWSTTANLSMLYETLASAREGNGVPGADDTARRSLQVSDATRARVEPAAGEPERVEAITTPNAATPGSAEMPTTAHTDTLWEHGSVVAQLGAMLHAAEAAGEAIRAEAAAEAEKIKQAAVAEREAQLAQVRGEAERVRSDAERAAKDAHDAVDEAARHREQKLEAQTQQFEASLRRALDACRGITAQIEDFLDRREAPPEETLADALSESVREGAERGSRERARTND